LDELDVATLLNPEKKLCAPPRVGTVTDGVVVPVLTDKVEGAPHPRHDTTPSIARLPDQVKEGWASPAAAHAL
jgi:hypothetical protein